MAIELEQALTAEASQAVENLQPLNKMNWQLKNYLFAIGKPVDVKGFPDYESLLCNIKL